MHYTAQRYGVTKAQEMFDLHNAKHGTPAPYDRGFKRNSWTGFRSSLPRRDKTGSISQRFDLVIYLLFSLILGRI